MAAEEIKIRLTADSIQSPDDVKPWARGFEARMESRLDQEEAATALHKKLIARNSLWLWFSVCLFAPAFAITVFLFWISQIFKG